MLYYVFVPPVDQRLHDTIVYPTISNLRLKFGNQNITKYKPNKLVEKIWFNKIVTPSDIVTFLRSVYESQQHAFKINVSFRMVFEKMTVENDEDWGRKHLTIISSIWRMIPILCWTRLNLYVTDETLIYF